MKVLLTGEAHRVSNFLKLARGFNVSVTILVDQEGEVIPPSIIIPEEQPPIVLEPAESLDGLPESENIIEEQEVPETMTSNKIKKPKK